jgi:hypothetical protein
MINRAIYDIISTTSAITDLVSEIHMVDAPQQTPNPCLVIRVVGQDPVRTKDATPVVNSQLEVNIFTDKSPDVGWEIESAVRTALDRHTGTSNELDIFRILWDGSEDGDHDPDLDEFHVRMGFLIRTK